MSPEFRCSSRGAFLGAPALRSFFVSVFLAFGDFSLDALLAFQASASLWGSTAHKHGGRAGIIVEYLETSAKAFARDSGRNDIDLGSHLGSGLADGSEIERNDRAQWQGNRGLSERNAVGVDKAPVNGHTIWYANVDEVEPRSLIQG